MLNQCRQNICMKMYKKQLKCTKAPKQVSQECINSRFFPTKLCFLMQKKTLPAMQALTNQLHCNLRSPTPVLQYLFVNVLTYQIFVRVDEAKYIALFL